MVHQRLRIAEADVVAEGGRDAQLGVVAKELVKVVDRVAALHVVKAARIELGQQDGPVSGQQTSGATQRNRLVALDVQLEEVEPGQVGQLLVERAGLSVEAELAGGARVDDVG